MANIKNIDAEVGANFIADDAGAAGLTFSSSATTGLAVSFNKTVISSPTVGVALLSTSGASIPVFQFAGAALTSASTILFTTGGVAGTYAVRVVNNTGTALGWIPVLPDSAVTLAALS